jgi:hypothetical protein
MSGPLSQHPAWPRLTADQRKAVNEVWNDMVVPALEEVAVARRERDEALLEAQDARGQLRRAREEQC